MAKLVPENLKKSILAPEIHKTEELVPVEEKPFKTVLENDKPVPEDDKEVKLTHENLEIEELVPEDYKKVKLVPENLETEESKVKSHNQGDNKTPQPENIEKEIRNFQPTVRNFLIKLFVSVFLSLSFFLSLPIYQFLSVSFFSVCVSNSVCTNLFMFL